MLSGCAVALPAAEATAGGTGRLPVPANAAALLHAEPRQVQGALGLPDLRRAEAGAQVWLYAASAACRVDVVFYPEDGTPRVAHAAARVTPPLREDACLRMVAARP